MSVLALNPEQEKSVRHIEGNSLVIAGAGSGKTRTLIAKIIYLIQNQKIPPHNILAITFTNKAAREMRERITYVSGQHFDQAGMGWGSQGLQIRTFHSFGVMFLRRFLHEWEGQGKPGIERYRRNFTIIDPDDQKRILFKFYPNYTSSEFPFKKYLYLINRWKNDFLYPDDDDFEDRAREYYEDYSFSEDPRILYRRYMDYLKSQNLLDFDDLIGLTLKLLWNYPLAASYAADRWRYVLVDEYQDTNVAQNKIIEFFIEKGGMVTVVGDDQQSIYGFRGAQMDNILSFKRKYPRVEVFMLEENYRSTQPILNLANHVIAKNPAIYPKKLFTHNLVGEIPYYCCFPSDVEETRWVIEKISEIRKENPDDEIAIFYRTNYQSRILEDVLVRSRISYQIVRGQKFFERKEIKDVFAYLQWWINPFDRISFERMINTPPRRLGEKTLEKIFNYLEGSGMTLAEIFDSEEILAILPTQARKGWEDLRELFQELRERQNSTPSRLVNYLIQKSGLQKLYEEESDRMTRDQRLGNLDALFDALDTFVKETGGGIEDFILSISLGEEDEQNEETTIKLMTVHNAKGLEFSTVFVVGMEEGVFPHSLTLERDPEIEEERRLFYVAVTRAKKQLFLSSAALKYHYHSIRNYQESRFIDEIDDEFLIKETIDRDSPKNFLQTDNPGEHDFY